MRNKTIVAENVSKRYRIGIKENMHETLGGALLTWAKYPLSNYKRLRKLSKFDENGEEQDIIWALRDVSFEVEEGEVLGIIGKNGAGKSTMLKILSRITDPTTGKILIKGRVSSLLEVGTGFHPELTGRENVYLNGTIIGMSKKEIDNKFDEIVDFSGVGKFIDTPIKRYSTGMKVRLAFAVAAHIEPEILIIDEVLAVGDLDFQKKCLGKMQNYADGGRTVIFVSHNMGAIADLCHRTMLLENGKIKNLGPTENVVKNYLSMDKRSGYVDLSQWNEDRKGDGPMRVEYLKTVNSNHTVTPNFSYKEPIIFKAGIRGEIGKKIILAISIRNEKGHLILHLTSMDDNANIVLMHELTEVNVIMDNNMLNEGTYYVSVFLGDHRDYVNDNIDNCLSFHINTYDQGRLFTKSHIRMRARWEVSDTVSYNLQH